MLQNIYACILMVITVASMQVSKSQIRGCDYRLTEQAKYSSFQLQHLGIFTNRSICVNGVFFGAGKGISIFDFLSYNESYLHNKIFKSVVAMVKNGLETTNLIILDIETPVHPRDFVNYNDTFLKDVVNALKLRLSVTRNIFPFAKLGLYATTVNPTNDSITGYQRASRLGLFDNVDYLVPVLYLGTNMNATEHTNQVLRETATLTDTQKHHIPMAPLLSWMYFGGAKTHCAVDYDKNHAIIEMIIMMNNTLKPSGLINMVQMWSGKDNETTNATTCGSSITQRTWIEHAQIVPLECV